MCLVWRLQPVIPCSRKPATMRNSVVRLPVLRIFDMFADLAALVPTKVRFTAIPAATAWHRAETYGYEWHDHMNMHERSAPPTET